jgi:hypothetical protein
MTKGKPTKESFIEWSDSLSLSKMCHLGEYYEYLTGKEFHTQQASARVPAKRWLIKYFYGETADPVFPFKIYLNEWAESNEYKIEYYRDWFGEGFLFMIHTL